MDFPRNVFTKEGDEKCSLGTYGIALVEDKEEFDAAMKAGYKKLITDVFEKEVEAKKAAKNPFKKSVKKDEDDF